MSGGFALLSRLAVTTEVYNGSLHAIPMRDIDLTRELHAVRHPSVRATGDTLAFWQWLAPHDITTSGSAPAEAATRRAMTSP